MNKILLNKVVLTITLLMVSILYIFLIFKESTKSATPNIPTNTASTTPSPKEPTTTVIKTPFFQYIEILDSCGPYYVGDCVNVRSGPGTKYSVMTRLRTGVVLKISEIVTINNQQWYKIELDKFLLHPERITGDWFVASDDYIRLFTDIGDQQLSTTTNSSSSSKRIIVDVSKEILSAYDGDTLFMQESISTGLEFTPTPDGKFTVYKKTPSRYMQGPVPGSTDQSYDLPGVPWDLYFTYDGDVIHGTYWHDHFGQRWSHGCVNLPSEKAKELYQWADIGTPVVVQN